MDISFAAKIQNSSFSIFKLLFVIDLGGVGILVSNAKGEYFGTGWGEIQVLFGLQGMFREDKKTVL